MAKFENNQNISGISFTKVIHNYCPMGKDLYTNNISVVMKPNKTIPDYIDIDKSINELEGKSLIIEDVVSNIYNMLINEYEPIYVKVSSYVEDAVHLPVTVTRETK